MKNRGTRNQPMFVLVCLYNADVFSRSSHIESLFFIVSQVQWAELRPSHTKNPYIFFVTDLIINYYYYQYGEGLIVIELLSAMVQKQESKDFQDAKAFCEGSSNLA